MHIPPEAYQIALAFVVGCAFFTLAVYTGAMGVMTLIEVVERVAQAVYTLIRNRNELRRLGKLTCTSCGKRKYGKPMYALDSGDILCRKCFFKQFDS